MTPADTPVLLYDGTCGLCASSVQFILRHERGPGRLRFAPLQGAFAARVRDRHHRLEGVDSMVWVEPAGQGSPERFFVRSAAVLRVTSYLGGFWRLLGIGWLVPAGVRDAVYDFVARHRHTVFGAEVCYLPPPDVRARFLE